MARRNTKKTLSTQELVETGIAEAREGNLLRAEADGWSVLLEWKGSGRARSSVERREGFTLVHFDFPDAPGDYSISVQQPFIDIQRSWAGKFHAWQGLELTSIALNFNFDTAVNCSLPVICNYTREGVNRGVIGMLDHAPLTKVNQRPILDEPPMHLLQTRFSRSSRVGGFRETVVIFRGKMHFAQAIQRFMRFCRAQQGIAPLPASDWAREPVWCSWYSNLYKLNQRQVEAQIPYFVKLGFRTVLIDASWFQSKDHDVGCGKESGEYRMNTDFFPDFPALLKKLRDADLRVMLWVAPLFMGMDAPSRKAMERWCAWDGKERRTVLCPFCEETKAHARRMVERVMRDYQLDGIKFDFMDKIHDTCCDPAHDHGDGNYGRAMKEFMGVLRDGVLGVNPDAAIEYRISYSTLASQPYANCHRGNDAPYDADYIRRENLFLRLYCEYPSAVWSDYAYWHADEKPENISLMLGQQIFSGGVPTISLDLVRRSEAERRIIKRWLTFYQRHRESLARAELDVHSADSVLSVTSLRDAKEGVAFVLLTGQHVPRAITLKPRVRRVWVLNASAEKRGSFTLKSGSSSATVTISGRGPVEIKL